MIHRHSIPAASVAVFVLFFQTTAFCHAQTADETAGILPPIPSDPAAKQNAPTEEKNTETEAETNTKTTQQKPPARDENKSAENRQAVLDAIQKLNAPSFDERMAATQFLLDQSENITPQIVKAMPTAPLESKLRMFRVLESLYKKTTPDSGFQASEALETLALSDNANLSRNAGQILGRRAAMRARVATYQIEKLGGRLEADSAAGLANAPARPSVFILPTWKGGDDGLKHVERLEKTQVYMYFTVYLIRGTAISEKGQLKIRKLLGDNRVAVRGGVKLGISWNNRVDNSDGCLVSGVTPGGAAGLSGIRPGDLIVRVDETEIQADTTEDGEEISPFDVLIRTLRNYSPGQKCQVEVRRAGKPEILTVNLKGWGE